MDNYTIHYTDIRALGGVPALFADNKPVTPFAYMTYLEKFNRYSDFAAAGCRLFSLPVLFAGRWISAADGFKPFARGIFDTKGKPDYSVFDASVGNILKICPDALIIPRVNMCMPVWWENENPDSVNLLSDGTSKRESFYSAEWRAAAAENLRLFIEYTEGTDYAAHIAGYQLAGGNTEEWFHFDLNGGCCRNAENGFREFLGKFYPDEPFCGLPDLSLLKSSSGNFINNANLSHFLEYASFAVADSIKHFAAVAKAACRSRVPVGAFYGYTLEVTSPLWGTHALKKLLEDENIDFICSPNSYAGIRAADFDWTEMYPADSVRLHGKMCFQECDIRTHLTVPLYKKDIETDPEKHLSGEIWQGVSDKRTALGFLRRSFCRQLIKGNGFWWFDMWGGWFADDDIMREMSVFRRIYEQSLESADRTSVAQLAVFADESAYKLMTDCALRNAAFEERKPLGLSGVPYDIYDVSDFEAVYNKYKAFIFMSCAETEYLQKALALCTEAGTDYLIVSPEKMLFTADEIRTFCRKNGIHIFSESDDIIYINRNYAAIFSVTYGEKTVKLDSPADITPLLGTNGTIPFENTAPETVRGTEIKITMQRGETVLFKLSR